MIVCFYVIKKRYRRIEKMEEREMGHFYFTRHGQTVWNVENKICGETDIELTELGHEQTRQLGQKILAYKAGILGNSITEMKAFFL